MKILHTSDWHLGQNFMFHDRRREHSLFLEWLLAKIREHRVDLLIIAGDIFDTGTPPNYAEELYFRFLAGVAHLKFCHVVVLGGNHDSVSSLNSSRRLLKLINTHVVASCSENIEDDIIVIKRDHLISEENPYSEKKLISGDSQNSERENRAQEAGEIDGAGNADNIIHNNTGESLGIICCVPFLRERDIRSSSAGESYDEKAKALIEGVREHYDRIYSAAVKRRDALIKRDHGEVEEAFSYHENENRSDKKRGESHYIPIIATGHLFAAGGTPSDGIRDIYVGNLGHVEADAMDRGFDYVALGHLHRAQLVGKREHIRYCGSPVALSFSEASREKQIIMVEFDSPGSETGEIRIEPIAVPEFQKLRKIAGSLEEINRAVADLELELTSSHELNGDQEWKKGRASHNTIWLEVKYTAEEFVADLKNRVEKLVEGKPFELFNVIDMNGVKRHGQLNEKERVYLDEMTEIDIFKRRLESAMVPDEKRDELFHAFKEIMERAKLSEDDMKSDLN